MAREKITKRLVDSLNPGDTVFDTDLHGFLVRAHKESITYAVKYLVAQRQRIFTIGKHGALTPDQARTEAIAVLSRVARGEDPQAERAAERLTGDRTFAGVATLYLQEHARPKKKERSVAEDEKLLRLHLLPALGRLDIEAISKADILRLRSNLRDRPIMFNRVRALASVIFNLAEQWDLRKAANPTRFVEKFPERRRERYLTDEEYRRLNATLTASEKTEHPSVIACIRLLALTGARLSEILTLRWEWADFDRAALRLPDSKTGAKIISLPPEAMKVLKALPRLSNDFVLPGNNLDNHFVGIERPWRRIREKAKLPDLRLHDLRHAFASRAADRGESLKHIGAALGHRQTSTTDRYAHLSTAPIKAMVDRIAPPIFATLRKRSQRKRDRNRSSIRRARSALTPRSA